LRYTSQLSLGSIVRRSWQTLGAMLESRFAPPSFDPREGGVVDCLERCALELEAGQREGDLLPHDIGHCKGHLRT
jgi:hypothetical protein